MGKVVIYTAPFCKYCQLAKDYFFRKGINFEEKDVLADSVAMQEMVGKSHQMGVPVIEIDDEIFVGFDRKAIARKLGIS